MTVTQTAEYALRAVVWLSQNPGVPQTTQQLSKGTQVSVSYLPKVLQPLTRAQIVASQRGINGGYSLAIDPEQLTVLQVISCVDPIKRITTCPLKIGSHGGMLCPLHKMLDESIEATEKQFAGTTIANLLSRETGSTPLCESGPPTISIETISMPSK